MKAVKKFGVWFEQVESSDETIRKNGIYTLVEIVDDKTLKELNK